MKSSVSYACDEEAMYEKASVTPLTTWTMNAQQRRAAEDVPPARAARDGVLA